MFMFTELARKVERDGGVTKSEGVFRTKRRLGEIIREVRLGSIKARTRKLEGMPKRDKICTKTEKKNKTLEDKLHCRNS